MFPFLPVTELVEFIWEMILTAIFAQGENATQVGLFLTLPSMIALFWYLYLPFGSMLLFKITNKIIP
jgi:hypothetical protein